MKPTVHLPEYPRKNTINTIKAVRVATGLDLISSKRLIDSAPCDIHCTSVSAAEALVDDLRRLGVPHTSTFSPMLGDIHLHNDADSGWIEVRVEVNGVWRSAIKTPYDGEGVLSHFVSCDGDKPLRWPEAPL